MSLLLLLQQNVAPVVADGRTHPTPNGFSINGSMRSRSTAVITDVTVGVVGQSIGIGQGAFQLGVRPTVTGQSYTTTQGSLTVASSKALAGTSFAAVQGSVSVAFGKTLTGQAVPTAQGAFAATQRSILLTGQVLAYAQGVVTASTTTNNVSVSLVGQSFNHAQGAVGVSFSREQTGTTHSTAQGVFGKSAARGLTGQNVSFAQGTVTAGRGYFVALTGQEYLYAQGIVTASGADRKKIRRGLSVMTIAVEAPVWTTANRMYVRTGVSTQAVLTQPTRIDVLVRKVA